jgi:hypothetical protein
MGVVIDASNVSPDVLVWLKQANDGHYYIERKPNRFGSSVDRFQVSIAFAEKLQIMSTEQAWFAMEKFVGMGD